VFGVQYSVYGVAWVSIWLAREQPVELWLVRPQHRLLAGVRAAPNDNGIFEAICRIERTNPNTLNLKGGISTPCVPPWWVEDHWSEAQGTTNTYIYTQAAHRLPYQLFPSGKTNFSGERLTFLCHPWGHFVCIDRKKIHHPIVRLDELSLFGYLIERFSTQFVLLKFFFQFSREIRKIEVFKFF